LLFVKQVTAIVGTASPSNFKSTKQFSSLRKCFRRGLRNMQIIWDR
jgi:hypothetical protein